MLVVFVFAYDFVNGKTDQHIVNERCNLPWTFFFFLKAAYQRLEGNVVGFFLPTFMSTIIFSKKLVSRRIPIETRSLY